MTCLPTRALLPLWLLLAAVLVLLALDIALHVTTHPPPTTHALIMR